MGFLRQIFRKYPRVISAGLAPVMRVGNLTSAKGRGLKVKYEAVKRRQNLRSEFENLENYVRRPVTVPNRCRNPI